MQFYINILTQKINEIILEGLFLSGSNNELCKFVWTKESVPIS